MGWAIGRSTHGDHGSVMHEIFIFFQFNHDKMKVTYHNNVIKHNPMEWTCSDANWCNHWEGKNNQGPPSHRGLKEIINHMSWIHHHRLSNNHQMRKIKSILFNHLQKYEEVAFFYRLNWTFLQMCTSWTPILKLNQTKIHSWLPFAKRAITSPNHVKIAESWVHLIGN